MTATLTAILASSMTPASLKEGLEPWSTPVGQHTILVQSSGSRWLIDVTRRRFQHLERTADPQRYVLTGTWTAYTELAFYPASATLIVHPTHGAPLRTHAIQPTDLKIVTHVGVAPPPSEFLSSFTLT